MNIIYGKNPVINTIQKNESIIKRVILLKNSAIDNNVLEIIKQKKLKVDYLEKSDFQNLFNKKVTHQNILAEVKDFQFSDFKSLLGEQNKKNTILILDRIQDPNNFGAIIRSAVLFGVNGIIIPEHNQAGVTPAVMKASAGTAYTIPIVKVPNLSHAISLLKEKNYWIYCSYLGDESLDITKTDFTKNCVIILGNEMEGVANKIMKKSDYLFKIKTNNDIDSLNVSVAAGIILFNRYNNE
ncbi:23S rRNA (guanosine2251-2'-O)-methyltransferase [Spiroplasma helicoides]|uniref:23S rRNA (Guanosine2251-2'-O)-methyltransferase n=1 Tax=Spiroplasma helicoides TaxID=216938 RepID=A0A1B3SJ79_9MOLU|nr:23S rRNA (guanosine(2251)-2'-O)-methyltransferase RlmB [Spiroplasma helicoides]AOG59986.1 23S rRNA (guanosine2251-2'-O)-methyltransferase [Spiroplasma helicoides]